MPVVNLPKTLRKFTEFHVPKRIVIGRQWRHDIQVSKRQRKLRGSTPTMTNDSPLIRTALPTMSAAPPYWRCQRR